MSRVIFFLEKITSCADLVGSRLRSIFHLKVHFEINERSWARSLEMSFFILTMVKIASHFCYSLNAQKFTFLDNSDCVLIQNIFRLHLTLQNLSNSRNPCLVVFIIGHYIRAYFMLMDNPVGNSQRNKEKSMLNSRKDV